MRRSSTRPARDYPEGVRPTCYRCLRPTSFCLCNSVTPFLAHTDILLLQHPNEWRKYYGTAKLLTLAVQNCETLKGILFPSESLRAAFRERTAYLLYPGPEAQDCECLPLDRKSIVVAIDGTWTEARKIVYRNPFLQTLPRLSFSRPLRSTYRIRRQPEAHCLSTLESVAHLLRLNAAAFKHVDVLPHYESLFELFQKMVAQYVAFWPDRTNQPERDSSGQVMPGALEDKLA